VPHSRPARRVSHHQLRLYEFLIVLLVISFLVFWSSKSYKNALDSAYDPLIEFHAGIFSRMVANYHAFGKVNNFLAVQMSGEKIYFNELGWPANTDPALSPSIRNHSARECRQIWEFIFSNPPSTELKESPYTRKVDYIVSLNKNVICRYQLSGKQEGSYFIDYDITNGEVSVVLSD